ncbi:hypothetical protein HYH03_002005 [Edaphochlamys debaryana]|uniref:Uncharacterized protein n=1 Tax=Edaphochlamys debaryana TaxID=47281 RepID=A0A835YEX4_9CHLO|nr:hypothetical protein HYH03_002005 [Edaphochlamys debaryana]|eukprot:KAG2500437.1 hypothetical protein HYH03_002005 [Edaphochlamys debaryana]
MVLSGLNPNSVDHLKGLLRTNNKPMCALRLLPGRAPPTGAEEEGELHQSEFVSPATEEAAELPQEPSGDLVGDPPTPQTVAAGLLRFASRERDEYRCWSCLKKQSRSMWYSHLLRIKFALGVDVPREKLREAVAQAVAVRLGNACPAPPADPLTAKTIHPFLARLQEALREYGVPVCAQPPTGDGRRKRKRMDVYLTSPYGGQGAEDIQDLATDGVPGVRSTRGAPAGPFQSEAAAAAAAAPEGAGGDVDADMADMESGQEDPTATIAFLAAQLAEEREREEELRGELAEMEDHIEELSVPAIDRQRALVDLQEELRRWKALLDQLGRPDGHPSGGVPETKAPDRRALAGPDALATLRRGHTPSRQDQSHPRPAPHMSRLAGLPASTLPTEVPGAAAVPGPEWLMTACDVPGTPVTLWDCPAPSSGNTVPHVEQKHLGGVKMQVVVVDRVFEALHGTLLHALKTTRAAQRLAVVVVKGDSLLVDMCRAEPGLSPELAVSRLREATIRAAKQITPGGFPLAPEDIFVLSAQSMHSAGEGALGVQMVLEEERFVSAILQALATDGFLQAPGGPGPAETDADDSAGAYPRTANGDSWRGRHGGAGLDALASAADLLLAAEARQSASGGRGAGASGATRGSDQQAGDGCSVRLDGLAWAPPVLAELVGPALGPDGGPLGGARFRAAAGEGPGLLLQVAPEGLRCYQAVGLIGKGS